MNHISQRNKLEKQVSSYVAFLKIANRSQSVKLSKEIAKLSSRIDTIDQMPYPDQIKTLDEHFETKQSKLNFKTKENNAKEYLQMSNKKRNPPEKCKPIFGEAAESRRKAIELASQHKDIKPIRYILKH